MDDEIKDQLYRKHKCRFTKKLRRKMTPVEIIMWEELRNRRFNNLKFRRQVNIGPYIADFLCKQVRLIVELDGSFHDDRKEKDTIRDEYLRERGYHILRIPNDNVHASIPNVLQCIHNAIYSSGTSSPSPVNTKNI